MRTAKWRVHIPKYFYLLVQEKRMKKMLVTGLLAVPLLALSSIASAAGAAVVEQEPMLLSASEMDGVTAGRFFNDRDWGRSFSFSSASRRAEVVQINITPVVIFQFGNNNSAVVYTG